jgi:hypothetical protein
MIPFNALWLIGAVAVFALVAFATSEGRGTWWRPLVLAFFAAAGFLHIPLFGPDGGAIMPAFLYIFIGAPWPVRVLLLNAVLLFWILGLVFRHYQVLFAPVQVPEPAAMFSAFQQKRRARLPEARPWFAIVSFALMAGTLQIFLYLFWEVDTHIVFYAMRRLAPAYAANWYVPWIASVVLAVPLGAVFGGVIDGILRRWQKNPIF